MCRVLQWQIGERENGRGGKGEMEKRKCLLLLNYNKNFQLLI
jgi:hypothetical protein